MYDLDYFRDRLTSNGWGRVVEDDKYFPDEELMDSFPCFAHYTFAFLGLPALSTVQLEIVGFMEDKEMEHPHKLIQAGRGQGKSILSQCLVVWYLLNNPDEHILIVSAGSQRASNYTTFVKKLIGLLPVTRPMTPRNNRERTSTQAFDVAGATASDSPSVYATGVGGQITGMRATKIIFDDIESHLTVQSLSLTERVVHSMNEAFNLLMSGHDHAIFLSTPHSINSIYIDLLDKGTQGFIVPSIYPSDESVYSGFLAPFITDRIAKNDNLIGSAVDERLDLGFLKTKEIKIGKSNFKLQYQLDVSESDQLRHPLKLSDFIVTDVSDEDAPLKIGYSSMPDNMLYSIKHNGFKADRLYSPLYSSDERSEYETKIMSIDPSGKGKDELGIAIIYSLNTRLFVKKITGLQGGYDDDVMENISSLCALHGITTAVIEENWGGGMFTKMLEPHLKRISPSTGIDEIRVTGQKEIRIAETLEPLLNQHRLVIDKDTLEKDKQSLTKNSFTYQMSHLTKERDCLQHDDRLDALANGVIYLLESMSDNEEFGVDRWEEEELEKIAEVNARLFSEFDDYSYNNDYTVNY